MAHSDLIAQITAQHSTLHASLSQEREALTAARNESEKAFDQLHLHIEQVAQAELGKYDGLLQRIDHLLKTLGPPVQAAPAIDGKLARPSLRLPSHPPHPAKQEHRS
jgi:malate synthase